MVAEYVVAQTAFKLNGHSVVKGEVLAASDLRHLRAMLDIGKVKEIDMEAEKYDPKAMARLAKQVDKGITPGDPANPRTEVIPPVGVPNPNVEVFVADAVVEGDPQEAQTDPEQPSVADAERAETPVGDAAAAENATEGADAEAAGDAEAEAEADRYDEMTVAELTTEAKGRGIATNGKNKAALVQALRDSDSD